MMIRDILRNQPPRVWADLHDSSGWYMGSLALDGFSGEEDPPPTLTVTQAAFPGHEPRQWTFKWSGPEDTAPGAGGITYAYFAE